MAKEIRSMLHWNGCYMVAMWAMTTGPDPRFHDIYQFAAIALDSNINIRRDVMPLEFLIQPQYPDRSTLSGQRATIFKEACKSGFTPFSALDLFETWINRLDRRHVKGGHREAKMIPLTHDWIVQQGFIKKWVGDLQFEDWFHEEYRDTRSSILFLNDQRAMHAEDVYTELSTFGDCVPKLVEKGRPRSTALECAKLVQELYQGLTRKGMYM